MKLNDSIFWLGSEASLRHVLDSQIEFRGRNPADFDEIEAETSRLTTVAEGVATIAVHGPLTNEDSFFNQMFGMTSYNEIRNAIIEAVEDPDIDNILIDMDTDGGDAKGVSELADFISVAKTYKPISTYLSGTAFSAGYWIASATDSIQGGKMSQAGSIGVIAMVMNKSQALKDKGYEVNIFRGGKYKALANPYEQMSDTAKSIFQAKIDTMEGFFLDAVSENRGIPRSVVKAQVGEGLTFFAGESVENGLMDEVVAFDEFFNRLIAQQTQGSAGGRTILSEELDMKKKVLSAASVAAVASGAAPEAVKDLLDEVTETAEDQASTETAAETETETADPTDTVTTEEASTDVAASEGEGEGEAEIAPAEKAPGELLGLVSYLKDELAAVRKENTTLSTDLNRFKAQAETSQTNETALKKLANEYVAGMCVGMGMAAMNLEGMDTSVVLTQYQEVRNQFTSRFSIGSTAEVMDEEPTSSGDGMSWQERAAIRTNKL